VLPRLAQPAHHRRCRGLHLFGWACLASALFLYEERQLKAKLVPTALKHFPALGTLERISTHAI
ncbi:MAG: hypothetical protein QGF03_00460, partial [SAR324 cluster bacterium]|nr:hypothetical protein [SAR324 cluster bacterium]